jgi:diguanylate cyclase
LVKSWRHALWNRLRSDSQLAIITSFGACAVFGILPFAAYRFVQGNSVAAVVDLLIVGSILIAMTHAWRSGDRIRASLLLAATNTAGCLASAAVLGLPGLFWIYPALLGNFLLLKRGHAALLTAIALLFLTIQGTAYESTVQLAMFLVSASAASLIAFVFASRTENQRQALETLATLDSLTGVLNRRAMEQELQIAVEAHRRDRSAYGLAMLDLDHFKRINDEHGHEAGDEVLVGFAELMRRSTRKVDRCFRFGGEEFVLLMPATNCAALRGIDANLRSRIAAELSYNGVAVTVSIGAAALRPGEDWQGWLARADAALYQAKNEGRNRTVVDGEEVA